MGGLGAGVYMQDLGYRPPAGEHDGDKDYVPDWTGGPANPMWREHYVNLQYNPASLDGTGEYLTVDVHQGHPNIGGKRIKSSYNFTRAEDGSLVVERFVSERQLPQVVIPTDENDPEYMNKVQEGFDELADMSGNMYDSQQTAREFGLATLPEAEAQKVVVMVEQGTVR